MYICNDRLLTHMGCTEMRPCLCQTPCWLSSGQEALAAGTARAAGGTSAFHPLVLRGCWPVSPPLHTLPWLACTSHLIPEEMTTNGDETGRGGSMCLKPVCLQHLDFGVSTTKKSVSLHHQLQKKSFLLSKMFAHIFWAQMK